MSTHESEPAKMEDQVAVDLLERLNGILNPAAEAGGSPLARAQRESIELLGLLPFALDEAAPSPATREQLMAQIRQQSQPINWHGCFIPSLTWTRQHNITWKLQMAMQIMKPGPGTFSSLLR